jgi:hypothetical protein
MGSVHARGDTFLTFGLKALTETNTSRLATGRHTSPASRVTKIKLEISIKRLIVQKKPEDLHDMKYSYH